MSESARIVALENRMMDLEARFSAHLSIGHDQSEIKSAEVRAWNEAIEACARFVESTNEVTNMSTGERYTEPNRLNSLNGKAYAKSMRALKKPDGRA